MAQTKKNRQLIEDILGAVDNLENVQLFDKILAAAKEKFRKNVLAAAKEKLRENVFFQQSMKNETS